MSRGLPPGLVSDRHLLVLGVGGLLLPLALWLTPSQPVPPSVFFLPLHTLVEFVGVVAALLVFALTWHILAQEHRRNLVWLACALFAAALLDFAHALSFTGMPDLVTPSGPDKAIAFCLMGRLVTAVGMLLAACAPNRLPAGRLGPHVTLAAFSLAAVGGIWLVLARPESLPRFFLAGQGPTFVKTSLAWLLAGLFCLAALRFLRPGRGTPAYPAAPLATAAGLFAMGEIFLALYPGAGDFFTIFGHGYNIAGELLIVHAVYVAGIRLPVLTLKVREEQLTRANRELSRKSGELDESNRQLRQILDTAAVGMVEFNPADGRYLRVNEKFAAMVGYPRDEIAALRWQDLTWPDELPENEKNLRRLLEGETDDLVHEKHYRHRRGHPVPALVHVTVVRDAMGRPLRAVNIVIDLSAVREAESERIRLERQLFQAQKMEALGQLVGGIAHDFNNTLAVILGFSGLALRRHPQEVQGKLGDYLRQIHTAGERARDLIAKLLAYSRSQAGDAADIAPLPCAPAVKEAVKMLAATIPAGIRLVPRIVETPPCRIDPVDMHQLLLNLVINARDAIGEHGVIEIGLEPRHVENAPCAICQQQITGDFVVLSVRDSGPGIPPELLPRIFDPFFTTKEQGKGTGLGLSVVQGILRHAEGHAVVESGSGCGAVFRLLLPPAAEDNAPAVQPLPQAPAAREPRRRGRLLLVDDDDGVRLFLTEMLTNQGYEVHGHREAAGALNTFIAHSDSFDLLVTDQTMPGLYGLDLARAMLSLRPGLPVILMSGNPGAIDPEDLHRQGILRLCRKPVDEVELLDAIAGALGSRGTGDTREGMAAAKGPEPDSGQVPLAAGC